MNLSSPTASNKTPEPLDLSTHFRVPGPILTSFEWPHATLSAPSRRPHLLYWLQFHLYEFQVKRSRALTFNRKVIKLLSEQTHDSVRLQDKEAELQLAIAIRRSAVRSARYHQANIKNIQRVLGVSAFVVELFVDAEEEFQELVRGAVEP